MRTRLLTLVTAAACSLASAIASAQEPRPVNVPLVFNAEAGPLRTSACLQVTERAYPATAWWESAGGKATGPDRADNAFRAVIAAMKQKDRAALLKLSDPSQARDTAKFDQQANAFFQQLQTIKLLAVPRAYEFDGLVVYFGKFQSATETAYVPLVFAHQADDSYLFLPMRSKQTTFNVVADWFAPSGKGTDTPAYCTDAEVKRATHRVALGGASTWKASALLLTAASLETVKPTIDQMKTAVRGADISDLYQHMTPEGAGRLRQWFTTASPQERDQYKAALVDQQAFFVFDESPLKVVYTKTRASGVQVLYFTLTADKRLVWTNSSHITDSDQVFKEGPLFAAASAARPFSSMVIK